MYLATCIPPQFIGIVVAGARLKKIGVNGEGKPTTPACCCMNVMQREAFFLCTYGIWIACNAWEMIAMAAFAYLFTEYLLHSSLHLGRLGSF